MCRAGGLCLLIFVAQGFRRKTALHGMFGLEILKPAGNTNPNTLLHDFWSS